MPRACCVICGYGAQDRPALKRHLRQVHAGTNMTTGEAAARLGMTSSALLAWRGRGQGPKYVKFGGAPTARVMYRLKDIEAFEQANLVSNR